MKQYLEFDEIEVPSRKTKVFEVRNKETDWFLGTVQWANNWRQYTFVQRLDLQIQMSSGCMKELCVFIDELMNERKHPKVKHCKVKLKCFWCSKRYVDLESHTKKMHLGLTARSYDYNG